MSEEVIQLFVPDGKPQRIDVFMAGAVPGTSRARIQQSIKRGVVLLNGRLVPRPSVQVRQGDHIVWTLPKPQPIAVIPEDVPLDILYEDDYLLVVNKPAGMPTHPGPGHSTGTLVHALLYHTGGKAVTEADRLRDGEIGLSSLNEGPYIRPGIVHRLDKDTSGLLVVAKDDATHRGLAAQFEHRTIDRTYHGIVWGVPDPPEGRVESTIGRDPRHRKKMAVVAAARGKRAGTRFAVIQPLAFTALVAFSLETGRTHQIRVHAQHMGHAILGDPTYGGRTIRYGPVTSRRKATYSRLFAQLARQALHAKDLTFMHPRSGRTVSVTSELPLDMRVALDMLTRVES